MIYKFRVFSEENEKFLRSIELDEDDTFFSFNRAIQDSVGFNTQEIASFYLSNDDWDRLTQITLAELSIGDDDDIFPMETTKLSEFITEEGENLIYVFDFLSDRAFYIMLSEIKTRNSQLSYPLCTQKVGEAPPQSILNSKNLKRILTGSPMTNTKTTGKSLISKQSKLDTTAKSSTVKKGSTVTKPVADNKKISKNDAKKATVIKQNEKAKAVAEKPVKVIKPAKIVNPVKSTKGKVVADKKQQKIAQTAKNLKESVKKKKMDEDFDEDDLLIEDEMDMFSPKKKTPLAKVSPKKTVTTAKTKKTVSVNDFEEDDDSEDESVDGVKEEYGFDEDDLDDLGNLDNLEDLEELDEFNTFTKKIAGKKFSSIEDFEEDAAEDIEDDDFYDDPMFDNIDDYTDRI